MLSKRMQKITDFINEGDAVVDIGTDHAYLPIHLIQQGVSPFVIASDIGEGPLAIAKRRVKAAGLADKIFLRRGNGLDVLTDSDEVGTVVIAGMGGETIVSILSSGKDTLGKVSRLILQPMSFEADVRYWLLNNKYKLVEEALVREKDIYYSIIVAEKGYESVSDSTLLEIGPRLWEKKEPLLKLFLEEEVNKISIAIKNLEKAKDGKALERKEMFKEKKNNFQRYILELKNPLSDD